MTMTMNMNMNAIRLVAATMYIERVSVLHERKLVTIGSLQGKETGVRSIGSKNGTKNQE
jgi:hypothetical protein